MNATSPNSPVLNQQPAVQKQQQQQDTQPNGVPPQLNTLDKEDSDKTDLQNQWVKKSTQTSGPPHLRVKQAIKDCNSTALAAALAEGGPDIVNSLDPERMLTPLMMAVETGSLDMVNVLLSTAGIQVDATNELGYTAVYLACKQGESLILEALLEKGANPATVDELESTPFIAACSSGQLNCVVLIAKQTSQAHKNRQDMTGMTALFWAAAKRHSHVVDFLIRNGCDLNTLDNKGWPPSFHVVNSSMPAQEKMRLLKLMKKHGADLHYHSLDSANLFSIALDKDDAETLSALLNMGIGNLKDKDPVIHAAEYGLTNSCHCLLKHKFKFEVFDRNGYTPLMYAARGGHWEITEMLMCSGADPKIKNSFGQNALDLAAMYGQTRAASCFLQHCGHSLYTSPKTLRSLLALAVESETWSIIDFLREKAIYDSSTNQLLFVDDHL